MDEEINLTVLDRRDAMINSFKELHKSLLINLFKGRVPFSGSIQFSELVQKKKPVLNLLSLTANSEASYTLFTQRFINPPFLYCKSSLDDKIKDLENNGSWERVLTISGKEYSIGPRKLEDYRFYRMIIDEMTIKEIAFLTDQIYLTLYNWNQGESSSQQIIAESAPRWFSPLAEMKKDILFKRALEKGGFETEEGCALLSDHLAFVEQQGRDNINPSHFYKISQEFSEIYTWAKTIDLQNSPVNWTFKL